MLHLRTLDNIQLDLIGKKILVREDLNVPIENGCVLSDARIKAAAINLKKIFAKQPKQIIIISHLGRPKTGTDSNKFSLYPIVAILTRLLGEPVDFVSDWYAGGITSVAKIVLCENLRFYAEEEQNSPNFAKYLASLADVFVMDAFATAHRSHASTVGVTKHIKHSVAGLLLEQELTAINKVMQNSQPPVVAIVAGSKVSTKLQVLENILEQVDTLILGGGIANTFLLANGINVGCSLVETELVPMAKKILVKAQLQGKHILFPQDAIVATEASNTAKARNINFLTDKIALTEKILDIGALTAAEYSQAVLAAKTILWNGPLGVCEVDKFSKGTERLVVSITQNDQAYSLAGGGDTIAAIEKFKIGDKISYISTGGGAFLEMLEGKLLPGVQGLLDLSI
jgi:phosphoglycerate kinase